MSAVGRLDAIQARIASDDPFNRLPPVTFVDAQAVVDWWLLGVFDEVMELVPKTHYVPAFRLQDVAYNETLGVLSGRYGFSRDEVADRLQGCDNLTIDRPLDPESTARKRAAKLRLQLCRLSGEDPSSVKKSRHLGEAEILAVIEEGHPGAYIVTGDTGAARAALLGTARPVHPFAFLAGVTPTTNELTKVWKEICSWRQCSTPAVAATCRTHLICQTSPPDPYRRCVISSTAPYADAATMTFTMDKKIDQLIRSL